MNEKQIFESFTRIFGKQELDRIGDRLVYQHGDEYGLFNEYTIVKEELGFRLEKTTTFTVKSFHSLRNAVIWASLDKANLVLDASRVENLDNLLNGTIANLAVHERLVKQAKNLDVKSTHLIKAQEDKVKKTMILDELDHYATKVRLWQDKRFKQISK